MKKIALVVVGSFIGLSLMNPAQAQEKEDVCTPVVTTVYVDRPFEVIRTVYVDRPVIQTQIVTKNIQVETIKNIRVEVPVYETNTVTDDPKTIRAMMKVTHDRYLALLAKYRQLKKAGKK